MKIKNYGTICLMLLFPLALSLFLWEPVLTVVIAVIIILLKIEVE